MTRTRILIALWLAAFLHPAYAQSVAGPWVRYDSINNNATALQEHTTLPQCEEAVPTPGVQQCRQRVTVTKTPPPVVTWTQCATEWTACNFAGTQEVRFGTSPSLAGQYAAKTFTGSAQCNRVVFGDPAAGKTKFCWVAGAVVAPPVVVPPVVTPPNPAQPAGTVLYDNVTGIKVADDFGCLHDSHFVFGPGNSAGWRGAPAPDIKVNAYRVFGMAHVGETQPGGWNLFPELDTAFARMKASGVKTIIYVPYNPPGTGDWGMRPVTTAEMNGVLDKMKAKIVGQYGFKMIAEVNNEAFGKESTDGLAGSRFWYGNGPQLSTQANQVLDWGNKNGVEVWSPSVAAFGNATEGNTGMFLRWVKSYPRAKEFSAFSLHLYGLTADNLGKPVGPETSHTAFVETRDALRKLGFTQPIVDGEKGFYSWSPFTTFNYAVKALIVGMPQACFFNGAAPKGTDSDIGQPWLNADARKDLEDVAALAGKTITKVVKPSSGGKYWVQVK